MSVQGQKLRVVYYPDPILRARAEPVPRMTQEVCDVAERMIELMHEHEGVGLAAPQVGLSWRLFVSNATGRPEDDRVFVNPILSDPAETIDLHEEGCLSIPDVRGQIRRPKAITIEALDLGGNRFTLTRDDLSARIWQHEVDHLDGVLIIDRMTPLDKMANRRRLRALEARGG